MYMTVFKLGKVLTQTPILNHKFSSHKTLDHKPSISRSLLSAISGAIFLILVFPLSLMFIPAVSAAPVYNCPTGSNLSQNDLRCYINLPVGDCPAGFIPAGAELCSAPSVVTCSNTNEVPPVCAAIITPSQPNPNPINAAPAAAPKIINKSSQSLIRSGGNNSSLIYSVAASIFVFSSIIAFRKIRQSEKD